MVVTPGQISAAVIATVGLVLTILNIIDKATTLKDKAREPEDKQNERISALEDDVKLLKEYISNDDTRIRRIEEGNRFTQQAILALLSHGIEGNNTEEMKKARSDLNNYLIGR